MLRSLDTEHEILGKFLRFKSSFAHLYNSELMQGLNKVVWKLIEQYLFPLCDHLQFSSLNEIYIYIEREVFPLILLL